MQPAAAWLAGLARRVWRPGQLPHAVPPGELAQPGHALNDLWLAYQLRWKRRRLLWRAWRKRRQMAVVVDRTRQIARDAILCFGTVRNEALRLPHFLAHHRALGVDHFLIVDNGSDDGTCELLREQPDVSLWSTRTSYKLSRFGMDWLTWLQRRHGHGHWCLTLDADECLIYPYWQTRPLRALTAWLERCGAASFGALMLDMYPKGALGAEPYEAGADPFGHLAWYDSGNYSVQVQPKMQNLWIQGGVRARAFFAGVPRQAPTLNKIPLVRWHRSYAYVNSTHALLPRGLNRVYDTAGGESASGILLHSKFLGVIIEKSREEQQRREHFGNAALYDEYYAALIEAPDLWGPQSCRYTGWRQLEAQGLMSRGGWI